MVYNTCIFFSRLLHAAASICVPCLHDVTGRMTIVHAFSLLFFSHVYNTGIIRTYFGLRFSLLAAGELRCGFIYLFKYYFPEASFRSRIIGACPATTPL